MTSSSQAFLRKADMAFRGPFCKHEPVWNAVQLALFTVVIRFRCRSDMATLRLRLVCFVTVLFIATTAAVSADSSPDSETERPKVSDEQLSALITQLDHRSYAIRETASQRLIELRESAVERLADAAERGSLETATRAVAILETLYLLPDDDDTSDASELALRRLALSKRPSVSARVSRALSSNETYCQRRALRRVVELGGVVKGPLGDVIDIEDPTALGREIPYLYLTMLWKGGDEELRHVKRLTTLQMLYVIEGCGVTDRGIEGVRKALPNLRGIEKRGSAYLGIGGDIYKAGEAGCLITSVVENSAADQAGIEEKDILREFDGKPVKDFRSLIEMIGTKVPGNKVELIVERKGKTLTLEATLDGWERSTLLKTDPEEAATEKVEEPAPNGPSQSNE